MNLGAKARRLGPEGWEPGTRKRARGRQQPARLPALLQRNDHRGDVAWLAPSARGFSRSSSWTIILNQGSTAATRPSASNENRAGFVTVHHGSQKPRASQPASSSPPGSYPNHGSGLSMKLNRVTGQAATCMMVQDGSNRTESATSRYY